MQLQQKYKDKIDCVSVNLDFFGDDREGVQAEVLKTLRDNKIAVRNIIQADGADHDVQEALKASIPIVLVYDQAGKLSHKFHNGQGGHFTYQKDVIPYVDELFAKDKSS